MQHYFLASKRLFSDSEQLSHRLMAITVGFSRRYRVPLTSEMKRSVCRRCHILLVPGKNCRVRIRYPNIVATCMSCGHYNKYGYSKP